VRPLLTSATANAIRDNALSGSIAGDVVFPYHILLYVR